MSVALVSRLKIYYLENGSKFKFVCVLFDTYVIFILHAWIIMYFQFAKSICSYCKVMYGAKLLVCLVLYIS